MSFVDRYLDDLEHRYPEATNAVEYEQTVFVRILGERARGGPSRTPREVPTDDTATRADRGPSPPAV
jgi:hypothetical protein